MQSDLTTSGIASGDYQLVDNHDRPITYLRLAITDRCNLRCRYCRPEEGLPFIPHDEILRFEELERLVSIFCNMGVSKVRVTGGEPFSRRDCMPFLKRLKEIQGLEHLHLTTNGVKTSRHLDELAEIGVAGINLSLDTLDPKRFWSITRRDYLDGVLETLHGTLKRDIQLKVNSVILADTSDDEIIRISSLARDHPITLRFIERMPFSGTEKSKDLNQSDLFQRLKNIFPQLSEYSSASPTTARIFSLPDFRGKLGIIEGYSRLFCKTCNKVRITPAGILKTCLYDNGALNLKELLRTGKNDTEISESIITCIKKRFINGHEAERSSDRSEEPSMSVIGG